MDITELLNFAVNNQASDLHLSAGLPPMMRVDGEIQTINQTVLDHQTLQALIEQITTEQQRRDYQQQLEIDFSFALPDVARFRVNLFNQNRGGV